MNQQSNESWNRWVHRFGTGTNALLLLAFISFPVIVSAVTGIWPDFAVIFPAVIAMALFMIPWAPGETIGFMPIMGPGPLYMSYITGNITNLKLPATVGTINSLGIEEGSDECHAISLLACGASSITVIVLLALGVVLAVPLQPVLEAPALKPAFDYAVPAIFGGLVAQTIFKSKVDAGLYLIPLAMTFILIFMTTINSAYFMLIVILVSGAVRVAYYLKVEKKRGK